MKIGILQCAVIILSVFFTVGAWASSAFSSSSDSSAYTPIPELEYHNPDDDYSIFDDMRIHLGLAFINSIQNIPLNHAPGAPDVRKQSATRGFGLNLGVDMFSPHWIVQGQLMTLPETSDGNARFSSNGFELRLLFDTPIYEGVTIHAGAGVASRNYDIKTTASPDGSVTTAENSFQSGATVLVGGLEYWPNGNVSAGLELTDHLPMASGDDPSSVDFALTVSGHF